MDHLDEYKHFLKAEAIPTPIHTPNSRYVNNKKVQEHYAIIPTKTVMTAAAFEQLSPLQQAIYEQVLKQRWPCLRKSIPMKKQRS